MPVSIGGNTIMQAAGANTQVQYNDNGVLGGNQGMVFDEGTSTLTANNFVATSTANLGAVGNVTILGGTNNYVLKTNGSGVLSWTAQTGGISGIAVQEEGTNVVATANIVNFVGSGVTASNVGGVATVTVPGGISGVIVKEEGTNVVASANTINFVGSGVTASNVGGVATVTVPGGISGITILEDANLVVITDTLGFTGPLVSVANVPGNIAEATIGLTIKDEGTVVTGNAIFGALNFVGAGVTVSADGNIANITVPGNTGLTGVAVQDEGTNVVATANTINFTGAGVTASNVGGVATVTINGSAVDTIYNKGNIQGSTTFSYNDGTIQTCTAIGNVYLDFTSLTTGQSMTALITQDSVGNRIATYPGANITYFAANISQLSTAPGAVDMINVVKIGSKLYATLTQGYTAA